MLILIVELNYRIETRLTALWVNGQEIRTGFYIATAVLFEGLLLTNSYVFCVCLKIN